MLCLLLCCGEVVIAVYYHHGQFRVSKSEILREKEE